MWWQLVASAIGLGLMGAPDVLGLSAGVADAFHVLGPITATFGAIAASEVLRSLRRIHFLLGPAIAVAPLLTGGGPLAIGVGVVAGLALVGLSFAGDASMDAYGGGWRRLLD